MRRTALFFVGGLVAAALGSPSPATNASSQCKMLTTDPNFPTSELAALNASVDGRVLRLVGGASEYCNARGGCSEEEWESGPFHAAIPGNMMEPNWESDYYSDPPSICYRNYTNCGQGLVPSLAINASTAQHVQLAVQFAAKHNIKVVVKSSGHDYLGRSTDPGAFLIWTWGLQNITFAPGTVTVGSAVGFHDMYNETFKQGVIAVGGNSGTVAAAGGYVQGGGHSATAPLFGMAADNAVEFEVVLADGSLVTVNDNSHPDLFYALRGGGGGTWGVVINTTFKTYPSFTMTKFLTTVYVNDSTQLAHVARLHADHIFDGDHLSASGQAAWAFLEGEYFFNGFLYFFNDTTGAVANATMKPWLDDLEAAGFTPQITITIDTVNHMLSNVPGSNTQGGAQFLGSRIIPESVYQSEAGRAKIEEVWKAMFDNGTTTLGCVQVSGGQVAKNANIGNAVLPAWRTAKLQCINFSQFAEDTPVDEVKAIALDLTQNKVPLLNQAASFPNGSATFAYANEGDPNEPDWQHTYFGDTWDKLSSIKKKYDPCGMFIVRAGVGSEQWDSNRVCRL